MFHSVSHGKKCLNERRWIVSKLQRLAEQGPKCSQLDYYSINEEQCLTDEALSNHQFSEESAFKRLANCTSYFHHINSTAFDQVIFFVFSATFWIGLFLLILGLFDVQSKCSQYSFNMQTKCSQKVKMQSKCRSWIAYKLKSFQSCFLSMDY